MQPNTITLAVDELNTDSTTDYVFTRYDVVNNHSVYIGEDHTPLKKDLLTLYRGIPKQSGNFAGVSKSATKFSWDVEVEGVDTSTTLTSPIICEISFSIPLGATDAEVLIVRQRAIALLDRDDIMVPLNTNREI